MFADNWQRPKFPDLTFKLGLLSWLSLLVTTSEGVDFLLKPNPVILGTVAKKGSLEVHVWPMGSYLPRV